MGVRTVAGKSCVGCGCVITRPIGRRGPLPRYCSTRCRWATGNRAGSARRRAARVGLTCERCSGTFDGVKRRNRFCSRKCGAARGGEA